MSKQTSSFSAEPTLDPARFAASFDREARARGFFAEPLVEVAGVPLRAYVRRSGLAAAGASEPPRIYLSSGVHGDEPAPPQALLELLRLGVFDDRADWYLVPLVNPTGFVARTRENAGGIDLNRDYKQPGTKEVAAHVAWLARQPEFALTLCLHEDYEAAGFYLYELNPDGRGSLAQAMLAAARGLGPIEASAVIDGRSADEPGVIRPQSDPLLRDTWPEAIYLREHHTRLSYTLETASMQAPEQRVATTVAAVEAALREFLR